MQAVWSLVLAVVLVLATPAPGRAGTTREGMRAGSELAQGLTDKGRSEQPAPQGGGDGGWLGLAGRLLDLFSDQRPSTTGRGCAVGSCPSGMQCCCCGDQCYCKRECSLQRCR